MMNVRSLRILFFLLAFLSATVSWSANAVVSLSRIAGGFDQPLAIVASPDSSGRLFIVQQTGRIRIVDDGVVATDSFLDLSNRISCCGERGLLGLAFHPLYATNGLIYVDYTDVNGDTVIASYRSTDADHADSRSESRLLRIPQPFSNHNGGQLQFGPDGYLYVGMGDGGSGGDPGNRAQDLTTLLGKLLRIDVDHGTPYAIPADNPFAGSATARPEIWAYGLRNPWRFTFDRLNGDLWIADVGQGLYEEINLQRSGSGRGANYGWRVMEGLHCFNPPNGCDQRGLVLPLHEYDHSAGCSVTGGFRYRGVRFPALRGAYLFADFCSGVVSAGFENGNGQWLFRSLLSTGFNISTFGEDNAGELYLADYGGGAIYQINELTGTRKRPVKR